MRKLSEMSLTGCYAVCSESLRCAICSGRFSQDLYLFWSRDRANFVAWKERAPLCRYRESALLR
jgi:hypothetical protein